MHALLCVCLPRSQARTSLQARKKVCKYLNEEGFAADLRFAGLCDYFCVGGGWSGWLTLLRLKYEHPKQFREFWKKFRPEASDKAKERLFREAFPTFRGDCPVNRDRTEFYGMPDDAQVMDEPLFAQLKRGFSEEVRFSGTAKPNVIFADDLDDCDWPKTAKEGAQFWVVIVDYHF